MVFLVAISKFKTIFYTVKNPLSVHFLYFQFLGAHITLSNGTLHGISTINRTDNAILMYRPETKIFSQQFPIDLNKIYVSISIITLVNKIEFFSIAWEFLADNLTLHFS